MLDSNATFWNVAMIRALVVILSTRSRSPVLAFSRLEIRRVMVNPTHTTTARMHNKVSVVI